MTPTTRPVHGGFPGEVVVRRGHERVDCERELKAHPDYSVSGGTPVVFTCSCGRLFGFCEEESEGAWWEPIE